MKKTLLILFPLLLASCGNTRYLLKEGQTDLLIAVSPTPHGLIIEEAARLLEDDGYSISIREFNDYVLPNSATEYGDVDANFFQHLPYLEDFNLNNKTHLVSVGAVHYEPLGLYAGKTDRLDSLQNGARIAVPNDKTNEARALLLLEELGLIEIKNDAGLNATKLDIISNPKNLDIIELEAAQIARSLDDVDFGVINGNYALSASLPTALALESASSLAATTFANILVVRDGNQNHPAIVALAETLKSDAIKSYITQTFGDAVVPVR
ncbi:MAG: MetQ/NlpA family ABC transporter substrate-binding protein [Bacilli bacterium]